MNGLPELQEFQLSFSNDQANLSKINLADNPKLKKVVIKGAKSLETLDLTNSASTVEMFWLQSCPKMTTVDIHEMPITTFASADYATSGMNMQPDGTLIIATVAQKTRWPAGIPTMRYPLPGGASMRSVRKLLRR